MYFKVFNNIYNTVYYLQYLLQYLYTVCYSIRRQHCRIGVGNGQSELGETVDCDPLVSCIYIYIYIYIYIQAQGIELPRRS